MYLAEAEGRRASVVGSSNFTRSGLGCGAGANLEINLATTDEATHTELREWFDDLWTDDNMTRDVRQDVLAVLNRLGKEHAPELIYYKTLYELFLADIEARRDGEQQLADIHLYDTQIWQALYNFQKDGAISIINRLKTRGGCILADSVGLGKTWTALAVIKYFELQNENVLVLCPKSCARTGHSIQCTTPNATIPSPPTASATRCCRIRTSLATPAWRTAST